MNAKHILMYTIIMDNIGFLTLMQAFDSLFPIGAYAFSNGMETYVQRGIVTDKNTLSGFLDGYLHILPTTDLGFAAKAALGENIEFLDELCSASKTPYELRNCSEKLSAAFLKAENFLGNYPLLEKYLQSISMGKCKGNHSIAVGIFISETRSDIRTGLQMYCYNLLSAMVNHAVKSVPLRQLDGQKALSEAIRKIPSAAEKAIGIDIDLLGTSGFGFDLRSMQHEKLYSRIYIS